MTRTAREERTFYEVAGEYTTRPGALAEALGCDPLAPLDLLFSHARAEGAREERERIVALIEAERCRERTRDGTPLADYRDCAETFDRIETAIRSGTYRETDQ